MTGHTDTKTAEEQKLTLVTLWRLYDWGLYNRRNEALAWELSSRECVEGVLHVEHIRLRSLLSVAKKWMFEGDRQLRRVLSAQLRKSISFSPVPADSSKKLSVYSVVLLCAENNSLFAWANRLLKKAQYAAINRYLVRRGSGRTLLLAYPPSEFLHDAINAIRHDVLMADMVDDRVERTADPVKKAQVTENYRTILPLCSWVFSTSPGFNEKYGKYATQEIAYLPNGVDTGQFSRISSQGAVVRRRKSVGYIGVINDEFDFELFEYVVRHNPGFDFFLIGGASMGCAREMDRLMKVYYNFRHLGERSHREIPACLSEFDVLANFKKNDQTTSGGESIKTYEYLATGKPVVSTPVPPADRFADIVYVADNRVSFDVLLKKAVTEDNEELREKRRKAAADNSWARRADVILDKVMQLR